MLASPARVFRVAVRRGKRPRLVGPEILVVSVGSKPRRPHPARTKGAWKLWLLHDAGLAGLPPPPAIVPCATWCAQFVGLRMNSLRSRLRPIVRRSSLTPPNTSGIGSETAVILAVFG